MSYRAGVGTSYAHYSKKSQYDGMYRNDGKGNLLDWRHSNVDASGANI